VALVPPGPVTVTSTVPDPEGEVAVIEVAEFTVTPVAACPPKETVLPAVKFVPVMVTVVPPAAGPEAGETALTVGAGAGVPLHVTITGTEFAWMFTPPELSTSAT
jgi:heme/copper-type cytochrome/quinol oxidase subunit 2